MTGQPVGPEPSRVCVCVIFLLYHAIAGVKVSLCCCELRALETANVVKITSRAVIVNFAPQAHAAVRLFSLSCGFLADKATNPLNKETDWDNIKGFCDQLNNEPEG